MSHSGKIKSTVPVIIYLTFIDKNHVIFNYPEWNVERTQVEMRRAHLITHTY